MPDNILGRGLGSLIPPKRIKQDLEDKNLAPLTSADSSLAIDLILPNPQQPRHEFDRASMEDLVNSIKEHGIIQPLVVVQSADGYHLIAGERRLRAAKILGLKKVPVVFRSASEQQKLELALVENVQRQNLNPIERAYGYQRLVNEFNLTQLEVAKKVGQSRAAVANTLRLIGLPAAIQTALQQGTITEGHAKVLLSVKSSEEQDRLFKQIARGGLTVRTAEHQAQKISGRKQPRRRSQDPNMTEKEETLQQALGTKVEIRRAGQQGTVVVYFYSKEELDEIIKKINT